MEQALLLQWALNVPGYQAWSGIKTNKKSDNITLDTALEHSLPMDISSILLPCNQQEHYVDGDVVNGDKVEKENLVCSRGAAGPQIHFLQ